MRRVLLVAVLLLAPIVSLASEQWSTKDLWLLYLAEVAMAIDHQQTRSFTQERLPNGEYRWHEMNPLLGKHPSAGRINTHFAVAMLAVPVVAYYLHGDDRTAFLSIILAVEAVNVARNYWIGVRFSW